jgi:SpoVK/Ycf46/Vps4 family AAA+-type ATPase
MPFFSVAGSSFNLLLAEMDGFDVTQGIVVLAATYRPEVLGPGAAASRPLRPAGRDPAARAGGAAAILVVHC